MNSNIYQDFVKNFKIALTNCSVYFPQHPVFSQSIEVLKEKINLIIKNDSFLSMKVRPDSLIINRETLNNKSSYQDLANLLHRKKIKSIEIKEGVANRELAECLLTISFNEKDILAGGGISEILKNKAVKNIIIDELDYSQLIEGEGKQVKDVWSYFLSAESNQEKIKEDSNKFIEELERIGSAQGIKSVLNDSELSQQLLDSFSKLKKNDGENFKKGLVSLVKLILKDKGIKDIKRKNEFKNLFSDINPKQLAEMLLEMLKSKQSANPPAFQLFSTLVPSDIHKKTADELSENIKKNKEKINIDKIKDLFSSAGGQGTVALMYQKSLLTNAATSEKKRKFHFNQEHLNQNYQLILLDLFFYELNFERIGLILEKIILEIGYDYQKNIDLICKFAQIYKEKSAKTDLTKFNPKVQKIWSQAERNIFMNADYEKFDFLKELLENSTLEASYYLDNINEKRFNPLVLELFFKFFPDQSKYLSRLIKAKSKDPAFSKKIITSLSQIEGPFALNILKDLFGLVPIPAKIEILEVMKKHSQYDKGFFLSMAKSQNFNLRKKAIEVSVKFPDLYREIVKNIFSGKNYFGIHSKVILENLEIIKENYRPEALSFLQELKKRKYFWNRKIRVKANNILETYHERKN